MSELKDRPVGVVGAGRVGTALAVAMVRAGYRLIGISARSPESRKRASLRLPQVPQQDALALAGRSQILFLTVSDDAVEPVATHLAENGGIAPGQYVVHTSGVLGLDALGAARRCGAVPLAIHPAMTFPGAESDADRLSGLAFAITTPAAARPIAERLVD
ncbi:MAG: NAD(P)-binding domain-containing protein, partial [Micromonosporaceae bacterium]|nr:NAD(P)-binding domain-containing protein [Micromonosporaceae bacterium]